MSENIPKMIFSWVHSFLLSRTTSFMFWNSFLGLDSTVAKTLGELKIQNLLHIYIVGEWTTSAWSCNLNFTVKVPIACPKCQLKWPYVPSCRRGWLTSVHQEDKRWPQWPPTLSLSGNMNFGFRQEKEACTVKWPWTEHDLVGRFLSSESARRAKEVITPWWHKHIRTPGRSLTTGTVASGDYPFFPGSLFPQPKWLQVRRGFRDPWHLLWMGTGHCKTWQPGALFLLAFMLWRAEPGCHLSDKCAHVQW